MQMVSTGILLCSLQYTISSSAYNQLALHPVIETCFAHHTISIIGTSFNIMSAVQNIYVTNFSYFYHFYNSILVDCRAKKRVTLDICVIYIDRVIYCMTLIKMNCMGVWDCRSDTRYIAQKCSEGTFAWCKRNKHTSDRKK